MLKKLIASVTAFAMLVNVAMPLVQAAPTVTDPEMIDAIAWGYDNGLTKYEQADAFMPFNNLTREQSAKFASEFASEVLDIQPDTTKTTTCEFKDASIMDSTLVDSITKVCQQGIMFGYQGNFMPKQLLTRGNFATMVSRMLGGIDAMSSEQAHFDYLNSLGIMKHANLTSSITRGDAMLMLYRVANGTSADLCAIDPSLPGCKDVVTPPIVKKGDLNVALNPASPVNYSSVPRVGSASFGKVDFTAGSSDISLYSVSVTRQGLGDAGDISRIYFEKDGVRVTGKAAVSSDNKAVVSFAPALVVKAGTTTSLDLYADLSGAKAGGEHQFTSTAINSSAANTIGGFTTPILRTADYAVSTVVFTPVPSNNSYQIDGKLVELGQFRILAGERDVTFKAVTLNNSGVADLSYVSGWVLQRNGITISTAATVNGRTLTFAVKPDSVLNGQTALYSIKGIITNVDREGDSFQLRLKTSSDLNVVETATSFRTQVTLNGNGLMGNYTVLGADVKFATNPSFSLAPTATKGATNVILMSGTISSKTDVILEDPYLMITSTQTGAAYIAKRLTLTIGNSTFTHSTSTANALGVAYTGEFNGTVVIPAGQSVPVMVVADVIENNATPGATLKIGNLIPEQFSNIEYVANGDKVTSALGQVRGATVTVNDTNLGVANTGTPSQTVVLGDYNKVVMSPKFTTSYNNNVRINQFSINVSHASGDSLKSTTWYLKDSNGNTIANAKNNAGVVVFSNLGLVVTKAAAINTTVEIDNIPDTNLTGSTTLVLTGIDAVDTTTWNPVTANTVTSTLVVNGKAEVVSSAATNSTRLVTAGQAAATIGSVSLQAKNGDATLTKLVVNMTGSNMDNFNANNLSLVLKAGDTVVGTSPAINISGEVITFNSLNYVIPAGSIKTLTVVADVPYLNSIALLTGTTFGLTLGDGGTFTSVGDSYPITSGQIMSSNITVVKTLLKVSNPTGSPYNTLNPSLGFTLTPAANTTVQIDPLSFVFNIAANTTTVPTEIVLSSDANGAGDIYATGTLTGLTTKVSDISISAPTTLYLTVKDVSAWGTDGSLSISLTDFAYGDSVSDGIVTYPNIYKNFSTVMGTNIYTTITKK